jgi:hypothetical protein
MKNRVTPAAFDLIVRFETGGQAYYEGHYKSAPCWPGGQSGVTIGCGYDLGYETRFIEDWFHHFTDDELQRLIRCLGKRGSVARQALSGVRDIKIPWLVAIEFFNEHSLPQEIRKTLTTFPGAAEQLSANAFGALVSLVFNRGTEISDDPRRTEMKAIRTALGKRMSRPDLHKFVAQQLLSMTRLWKDDRDSDGDLVDRRRDEANLVITPDQPA